MSSRNRDSFNEINITPLTDIFLVLLIIMMVIAPLLDEQGLNLAVPEVVEEQDIKESKVMTFDVTQDGKYIFNDAEVPVEQLELVIKENAPSYPDGLLIVSEPNSTHGAVVKLIDSARNSGVKNISMTD